MTVDIYNTELSEVKPVEVKDVNATYLALNTVILVLNLHVRRERARMREKSI